MSLNMKIMRVERENEKLKEELITATNDFMEQTKKCGKENEELKKENEKLKKENEKLKKENEKRSKVSDNASYEASAGRGSYEASARRGSTGRGSYEASAGRGSTGRGSYEASARRGSRQPIPKEYLPIYEFAASSPTDPVGDEAAYGDVTDQYLYDIYEPSPGGDDIVQLYELGDDDFSSPLRISRTKKHKTRRKTSPKRRKTSPKRRKTSPKRGRR